MFRLDVSSPLSMSHVLVSGLTGPCPCARMSVSRATPRLLSDVCHFPCPVPYARSSSSMHTPRPPCSRPNLRCCTLLMTPSPRRSWPLTLYLS